MRLLRLVRRLEREQKAQDLQLALLRHLGPRVVHACRATGRVSTQALRVIVRVTVRVTVRVIVRVTVRVRVRVRVRLGLK